MCADFSFGVSRGGELLWGQRPRGALARHLSSSRATIISSSDRSRKIPLSIISALPFTLPKTELPPDPLPRTRGQGRPPNQSEMLFQAARKKGLPVAYSPLLENSMGFERRKPSNRLWRGFTLANLWVYPGRILIEPSE